MSPPIKSRHHWVCYLIYDCGCFGFLEVYVCDQVVFVVGYGILYHVVIGLVGVVL
jgi:hypothetical protein